MCKDYDLKKDIALKDYFRYNVNFADFFNGTIFRHKKVLDPKFLRERILMCQALMIKH